MGRVKPTYRANEFVFMESERTFMGNKSIFMGHEPLGLLCYLVWKNKKERV
jgi:hypothetical protein